MSGPRKETILESQVVLLAAHGVSLALGLVVTFLLARRLDTPDFAAFILISGALGFAGQFVDAGLQTAVVSEISRERGLGVRFLRRVLTWRFFLAVVAFIALIVAHQILPSSTSWPLLGLAILTLPLRTFNALFTADRRNRFSAWGGLLIRSAFCLIVVILASQDSAILPSVLVALLVREIALSLFPCWAHQWSKSSEKAKGDQPSLKGLEFLALATMFGAAYFHVDVFMLKTLRGDLAVADYGLAVRVLGPLVVTATLTLSPFLPFLSAKLRLREGPATSEVALAAIAGLGVMLPISMVLVHADSIVLLMIGEESHDAAQALQVLACAIPIIVFGIAFSSALIMAKRYSAWAAITALGLGLNLFLNYLLIPTKGTLGASIATIATEFLIVCVAIVIHQRGENRLARFSAREVGGALLASLAPSAVALLIYLLIFPAEEITRLSLAVLLALAAAFTHAFFGVARTLRRHFEARLRALEELQ